MPTLTADEGDASSRRRLSARLSNHDTQKGINPISLDANITGSSAAKEELFASWNGKILIITGLQDEHWSQIQGQPQEVLKDHKANGLSASISPSSSQGNNRVEAGVQLQRDNSVANEIIDEVVTEESCAKATTPSKPEHY